MKQARKVGKKIISEIEQQIEQLLDLRNYLHTTAQDKKEEVEQQPPLSFLLDNKEFPTKRQQPRDGAGDDKEI